MHSVFILDEMWDSALTHYAYGVYEAVKQKMDATVFCLRSSYVDKQTVGNKIYIKRLRDKNPILSVFAFLDLYNKLRAIKPDIVFTIRGDAMLFACILRSVFDFKLIRIFGDNRPFRFRGKCLNMVIFPSYTLAVKAKTPVLAAIVKGFVDIDKFKFSSSGRDAIRKAFQINDHDFVFGCVGRLDPVKGYPLLIKTFGSLHDNNAKLIIVGEEKNEKVENLKKLISDNNISDRVILITERRKDIVDIMSAFDVGVIPSIGSETIARTMFEFMSIGLPIIYTDVGMLKEVGNETFSIKVKPDVRAMYSAIKAIRSFDLKQQSCNARENAIQYSKYIFFNRLYNALGDFCKEDRNGDKK